MRPLAGLVLVILSTACKPDGQRTSDSDDGGDTTDAATSSAGTTAAADDDAATGTDAGGSTSAAGLACTDVRDCVLVNDCCTCAAIHEDEEPPAACDAECARNLCDLWGTDLLCSHTCLLQLVRCDPALVECADDPPTCEDGFAPAVEDRCWTQQCVPVELCTPY
jgi:hypothetical protein